jgi:hypothetical protein
VSDDSLLERVAAVAEDSHVTLDVGLGSEQLVLRMMPKGPSRPINVRITSIWRHIRKSSSHFVGRVR